MTDILRMVRNAAQELSNSLFEYWPSEGDCEISERNISIYLSSEFLKRDFKCFAEAHWNQSTKRKLDLFAVNFEKKISVICECKRLYDTEGMKSILNDIERIETFSPIEKDYDWGGFKKYGLICATTWNKTIMEWWTGVNDSNPTKHPIWESTNQKELSHAQWESIILEVDNDCKSENKKYHYLLCLIFDVKEE